MISQIFTKWKTLFFFLEYFGANYSKTSLQQKKLKMCRVSCIKVSYISLLATI